MHFRAIRSGDLDACAAMLPQPRADAESLAALWGELLREERISGGVVVETPASDAPLAFALSAFVEERFLADYLAAPRPGLSALLYDGVGSRRSLMLAPPEVRQANAAGALNFVILHFRLRPDLGPEAAQGAAGAAQAAFRLANGGYRIRRLLQEAYGPFEQGMIASAGLSLKSDYSGYFDADSLQQPPAEERPVLMGLYADDPESRAIGTTAAWMFHYTEPQFFFSLGEQRVLSRAALDESDEEIARELGLSIAGVKKIWRRAYERVDDNDPTLLAVDASGPGTRRGKEKRRALLRYLRYHLEELRPTVRRRPSQAPSRSGFSLRSSVPAGETETH